MSTSNKRSAAAMADDDDDDAFMNARAAASRPVAATRTYANPEHPSSKRAKHSNADQQQKRQQAHNTAKDKGQQKDAQKQQKAQKKGKKQQGDGPLQVPPTLPNQELYTTLNEMYSMAVMTSLQAFVQQCSAPQGQGKDKSAKLLYKLVRKRVAELKTMAKKSVVSL